MRNILIVVLGFVVSAFSLYKAFSGEMIDWSCIYVAILLLIGVFFYIKNNVMKEK